MKKFKEKILIILGALLGVGIGILSIYIINKYIGRYFPINIIRGNLHRSYSP